jgi:hypothetical protein
MIRHPKLDIQTMTMSTQMQRQLLQVFSFDPPILMFPEYYINPSKIEVGKGQLIAY